MVNSLGLASIVLPFVQYICVKGPVNRTCTNNSSSIIVVVVILIIVIIIIIIIIIISQFIWRLY